MKSLIRVELTRYRSRRVILLILAAAALLTALVAFKTAWDTRPATSSEIATAQAQANIDADQAGLQQDLATCLRDAAHGVPNARTTAECHSDFTPDIHQYLPRDTLNLNGTLKGNGIGIALLIAGLLIIAGSTFAGGDWSSGSIRNQVLFEPRRSRVWVAKASAVAIASGLVSLVLLAGFWVALYVVAIGRDVPHGSAVVGDIGWHLMRAVLLAMGAAVGAFALTTFFRHSVATLSLLFVYSIGGELVVYLAPISGISRWSVDNNVFGWLETRLEFFDPSAHCARLGTCTAPDHISHLAAGLYLLGALVLACLISWITFRRRDI